MFGRTAPLLHVHDFHVQHSPKLHLDPAKVMHRSVRRAAAAAPDRLSRIRVGKSQHSSRLSFNNSAVHQREISSLARPLARGQFWRRLRSADATIINLIRKLINSPSVKKKNTHTAEYPSEERLFGGGGGFTLPTATRAGQRRADSG